MFHLFISPHEECKYVHSALLMNSAMMCIQLEPQRVSNSEVAKVRKQAPKAHSQCCIPEPEPLPRMLTEVNG
jgi:hypothetical protein